MNLLRRFMIVVFVVGVAQGCVETHTNQSTAALISRAAYVSEVGEIVTADYRTDETVTLTFSDGHAQLLRQKASGSGIRYFAGQDEWWEHQGEATYSRNGTTIFIGQKLDRMINQPRETP